MSSKTPKPAGSATGGPRDAGFADRLTASSNTSPDTHQPGGHLADDTIKIVDRYRRDIDSIRKSKHAHIFAKEPNGHYVEPAWCSTRLFAVERFGPDGATILDPACGFGTILRTAQDAGYQPIGADIVDRRRVDLNIKMVPFFKHDFLNGELPIRSPIASIICNPPFDHVQEFCERALATAEYKVAMIFLLRRLPAARWLARMPLDAIYLLTPRPSMPPGALILAGEKPGNGSQDFCWLLFNKVETRGAPRLRWLTREADLFDSPRHSLVDGEGERMTQRIAGLITNPINTDTSRAELMEEALSRIHVRVNTI
jgi:hypothetical protein